MAFLISTLIHEKFSQVQVFFLTCNPVEFDQPDFYFLMAGYAHIFSRSKNFVDEIFIFDGDVQKVPFTRCLVMRHSFFLHVAHIVQFVIGLQIRPPFLTPAIGGF